MSQIPLMPRATAVWLVDNTSLSFAQIASFSGLHLVEVQGIADGEVYDNIRGVSPILNGQLTREEIQSGENDPAYILSMPENEIFSMVRKTVGARYTPLSRRHDRPNAILWLLRSYPGFKASQIIRLIGTTKKTIEAIRGKNHWNFAKLSPADPVTLGLCTQIDLDKEVAKLADKKAINAANSAVVDVAPADLEVMSSASSEHIFSGGSGGEINPSSADVFSGGSDGETNPSSEDVFSGSSDSSSEPEIDPESVFSKPAKGA